MLWIVTYGLCTVERAAYRSAVSTSFQTIVDLDATAEDAVAHGERVAAWLVREAIVGLPDHAPGPRWEQATGFREASGSDGLTVVTGRTVFFSPQHVGPPVCPYCAMTFGEGHRKTFSPAMDEWWDTGCAEVPCPACGRVVPLAAWEWPGDGLAFAYLGFEFRNGPALLPEFVAELSRVLGHRTRFVRGRI
ncbi:hypothetical protein ACFQ9Q_14340 [Streptomyces virginiae]|uniref:hypothetical protein n=1 Tax=Streptomyces virginiae TaxID=1961 RepID=UPI00068F8D0E|nr:hypothetical protein [Streptomyces virginiae]